MVPPYTQISEPILDRAPHGWMPNAGVPAVMVAGVGVSVLVNPVPPLASFIANPEAGLINRPDDVAVMT